jgi:hypothetical protein
VLLAILPANFERSNMMTVNFRHIGGRENSLGRHYSLFAGHVPCLSITCGAKIVKRPVESGEVRLVLRFQNNRTMASCCVSDLVAPGVDDWLAIDIVDEGHQAFLEFVFGADADVA